MCRSLDSTRRTYVSCRPVPRTDRLLELDGVSRGSSPRELAATGIKPTPSLLGPSQPVTSRIVGIPSRPGKELPVAVVSAALLISAPLGHRLGGLGLDIDECDRVGTWSVSRVFRAAYTWLGFISMQPGNEQNPMRSRIRCLKRVLFKNYQFTLSNRRLALSIVPDRETLDACTVRIRLHVIILERTC